jgi:hypothetical protein
LAHELRAGGPALGSLKDRTESITVRWFDPGTNTHDYDELAIIYSHLDSSTTIGSATATSTDAARGGALVSVSRSDRIKDSTVVERFADGSARITHITWAIG